MSVERHNGGCQGAGTDTSDECPRDGLLGDGHWFPYDEGDDLVMHRVCLDPATVVTP